MKRCITLLLFFLTLFACNPHHHRIDEDQVILILRYPDAKQVVLFCSLDGFKPRIANLVSNTWESALPAKDAFRYFYRVDDTLFVPDCPLKEKDDLGFENCIFDPHL